MVLDPNDAADAVLELQARVVELERRRPKFDSSELTSFQPQIPPPEDDTVWPSQPSGEMSLNAIDAAEATFQRQLEEAAGAVEAKELERLRLIQQKLITIHEHNNEQRKNLEHELQVLRSQLLNLRGQIDSAIEEHRSNAVNAKKASLQALLEGSTSPAGRHPRICQLPDADAPAYGSVVVPATFKDIDDPIVVAATSNVIFRGDPDASKAAMVAYAARLAYSRDPGLFRLRLFDPTNLGHGIGALHVLVDSPETGGGSVRCTAAEVDDGLEQLKRQVQQVNAQSLQGRFDLEQFNMSGQRPQPFYCAVAFDLPGQWSVSQIDALAHLAKVGPNAGVSVLASVGATPSGSRSIEESLKGLFEGGNWVVFDSCRWVGDEIHASYRGLPVIVDSAKYGSADEVNLYSVLARFREASEVALERVTPALELTNSSGNGSSLDGLDIPVGHTPTDIQNLGFNDDFPHGLVIGESGSGKSTLLHTIILSAARKYSPDELEIWLIDFKQGNEFKSYATTETNPGLPQVKVVAASSDEVFGASIFDELVAEIKRRGAQFGAPGYSGNSAHINDIKSYRKTTSQAMPRILAIIDECQVALGSPNYANQQRAQAAFEQISKTGRSHGVHLLLATQSLSGLGLGSGSWSGPWAQVTLRMALACSPDDSERVFSSGNKAGADLIKKRQAIVNLDRGRVTANQTFQFGFFNDDERALLRRELTGKWEPREEQVAFLGDELAHWTPPTQPYPKVSFSVGRPMSIEPRQVIEFDAVRSAAFIGPQESTTPLLVAAGLELRGQLPNVTSAFILGPTMTEDSHLHRVAESWGATIFHEEDLEELAEVGADLVFAFGLSGLQPTMPAHRSADEPLHKLLTSTRNRRQRFLGAWASFADATKVLGMASQARQLLPLRISAGTGNLGRLRGSIEGDESLTVFGNEVRFVPWGTPNVEGYPS